MSSFREQVSQTFHPDYEKILQDIYVKETSANQPKSNRTAIHIADRTAYAKDDVYLANLILNSGKSHNDRDIIASAIHGRIKKDLPEEDRRYNTVAVGIHNNILYVGFNHVNTVNKQQETFTVDQRVCKEIFDWLRSSPLLDKSTKVVFLQSKSPPTSQEQSRAPHAELQIMHYWKDKGLLQRENGNKHSKPYRIGASKPACLCCSVTMRNSRVPHKTYANTNIRPTNWQSLNDIKVQRICEFNVSRRKR